MKAFFWAGGDDGCAWYRMQLPAAALGLRGHTTHADQFLDPARWGDADVIVGQRICKPGPTNLWRQWADEGRRLVFDVDDHYMAFDDTNTDAYAFYTQPAVRQALADNIALASVVTCATPRLAEQMARYNPNVTVVPNGLPASILNWPEREHTDKVTIGWAGSPSTVAELPIASKALMQLLNRPPTGVRVSMHTVGVDASAVAAAGLHGGTAIVPTSEEQLVAQVMRSALGDQVSIRSLTHPMVRVTPWIPHTMDYLRAIDFDIWVAPYRSTPFNEAKVPTKALEAAFLGIPIIASDTEPYRRFVRHGETGYLARRPSDWATYLRRLATDPDLRTAMGKAAREQATQHTITTTAAAWERALTGASP